jgi:hypothetical protein
VGVGVGDGVFAQGGSILCAGVVLYVSLLCVVARNSETDTIIG